MMFTMPVYDMMLLPGVTFYFKKDIFQQLGNQDAKAGDDVLFLMQRTDKDRKDLTPEDFYPVGVSGKLDSVDNEGNIRIRTIPIFSQYDCIHFPCFFYYNIQLLCCHIMFVKHM